MRCSIYIAHGGRGSTAPPKPVAAPKSNSASIVDYVDLRLYAMPSQIGQKSKCPDCHAINLVQRPPEKTKPRTFEPADGYEIGLADEHPSALTTAHDQFNFSCRSCQAHLTLPRAWVGRQVPCPDCGLTLIVPFPPPVAKKIVVAAEETGLTLGIAATRPKQDVINVERLMTSAEERLAAEAKKRPKRIKHPFLTGIYTYPFYPSSLVYVVLTSFLGGLVISLVKAAVEMTGLAAVLGIFLMVLAVLMSLSLVGLVSSFLLKTVHWTSQAYPSVGESPPFEFFDFLRSIGFIINAFAISTLPGFLIGVAAHSQWVGFGSMLLCAYIFYPLALLSMLDDESIMSFYSGFIFSTLRSQRWAWLKFYVSSLIPFGLIIATQALAFFYPNEVWDYVTVVTSIVALLIYFRLLGRLAYVIDRSIKKTKPQRA